MLRRTCPSRQSLWIIACRIEIRLRHRCFENLHGVSGRDVFQRVHARLRGRLVWRPLIQLIDQRLDFSVVLGRCPCDHLSRFGPQRKTRIGERGGQEVQCLTGCGHVHAFERVDHHFRGKRFITFNVDLFEDRFDCLMVRRARKCCEALRILRVHRQLRLWHGRLEDCGSIGRRDILQRVEDDLGRGLLAKHFDEAFDFFVIFRSGPRDDLVGLSARDDAGLRENVGQEGNRGRRRAGVHALQRVNHRGGSRVGGSFHVDRFKYLLDRFVISGFRPGSQTLRVIRARGQFGFGYRRLKDLDRAGSRDRLQRVDSHVRLGLLVNLVDQHLDLFVVFRRSPRHHLSRCHTEGEPSFGKRFRQKTNGIDGAADRLATQSVDVDRRRRIRVIFDIDGCENLLDRVVVFLSRPRGQPLRIIGTDRDFRLRNSGL